MAVIPIIPALIAGGVLVPHSAGGLIVTGSSGYVTGTYLSTTTIAGLLGGSVYGAGLGTGILGTLFGSALIGSAGFMGTGIGASGLTGLGIKFGLIPTTSLWVPVLLGVGIFCMIAYIATLIIGSARFIFTGIFASGLIFFGVWFGFIPNTPLWLLLIWSLVIFYVTDTIVNWVQRKKLKENLLRRTNSVSDGEEVYFTEKEAKFIQDLIKFEDKQIRLDKKFSKVLETEGQYKKCLLDCILEKKKKILDGEEVSFTEEEVQFIKDLYEFVMKHKDKPL